MGACASRGKSEQKDGSPGFLPDVGRIRADTADESITMPSQPQHLPGIAPAASAPSSTAGDAARSYAMDAVSGAQKGTTGTVNLDERGYAMDGASATTRKGLVGAVNVDEPGSAPDATSSASSGLTKTPAASAEPLVRPSFARSSATEKYLLRRSAEEATPPLPGHSKRSELGMERASGVTMASGNVGYDSSSQAAATKDRPLNERRSRRNLMAELKFDA